MTLLAIGRPRPGIDAASEIARQAKAEHEHVWRMYVDGLVREMYSPGGPRMVASGSTQARRSPKLVIEALGDVHRA
jgi:hypothetical protein